MEFVIAGNSPRLTDNLLLLTGRRVVALSTTALHPFIRSKMDYWLIVSPYKMVKEGHLPPNPEMVELIKNTPDVPKYIQYNPTAWERMKDWADNIVWWTYNKKIPGHEDLLELKYYSDSATAGMSLARFLGATKIILVGVDIKDGKFENVSGEGEQPAMMLKEINRYFREGQPQGVKVFKTTECDLEVTIYGR